MDFDGDPVAERWNGVLAPIVSQLSPSFSLEELIAVVGRETASSITLEVLPPALGPEVSGLSVVVDGRIRIYHPPGPEWVRLVVAARQVAHLLLHRLPASRSDVPTCTVVDQDGELLGILLVDHVERQLVDHGTLPAGRGATAQEDLELLVPLRARLADGTADLPPWPEPLRPGTGSGGGAPDGAGSEARLRWRRQRVVTDIHDLLRCLRHLVPAGLPALAFEHVREAGLSGRIAATAADRICLEGALAARRAGGDGAGRSTGDRAGGAVGDRAFAVPGRTPSAAAAFVAEQERLTRAADVRHVIDTFRDRFTEPQLARPHA